MPAWYIIAATTSLEPNSCFIAATAATHGIYSNVKIKKESVEVKICASNG